MGNLAVEYTYPESFSKYPSVFVLPQKRVAWLHGWLFQDSSFSTEHSGKGVLMLHFHPSSPHRPILQTHETRPAYHCVFTLPRRPRSCVITRLRLTWQRCSCQRHDFEPSACPAVYFALSCLLSGTGVIRRPMLMEYFWRVLHGTGRKLGTRLVLAIRQSLAQGCWLASRFFSSTKISLYDGIWRFRRVSPCPISACWLDKSCI